MVGRGTPEASAKARCSIPTSARAAFICGAVSNVCLRSPSFHSRGRGHYAYHVSYIKSEETSFSKPKYRSITRHCAPDQKTTGYRESPIGDAHGTHGR